MSDAGSPERVRGIARHSEAGWFDSETQPPTAITNSSALQTELAAVFAHLRRAKSFEACLCLKYAGADFEVIAGLGLPDGEDWIGERLALAEPWPDAAALTPAPMSDAPFAGIAARTGLAAGVVAPLVWHDRILGLLLILHARPRRYTPHETELTLAFARQAAMAIEMAGLYADAQRRSRRLEAVSEVSQQLTSLLVPDEILSRALRLIREKLGYYHSHLYLVEPDTDALVLRVAHGNEADVARRAGLRFPIGDGSRVGWVAATGELALSGDAAHDHRYHPDELLGETRSAVAAPLNSGFRVIGVLDVQSHHAEAFAPEDVTALQILADQLAVALENARLFAEAQSRYQMIRALHDIAVDITGSLDLQTVLNSILEQAVHLLQALGCSLGLLKPETGLIHLVAFHNYPPDFKMLTMKVGEGAAGRAVATGEPQIVNDYKNWPARSSAFENAPFDAILSVPLRWEGQIIGSLNVVDQGARRPFTATDAEYLRLFAELASIALKNAELHAQVRLSGDQLEAQVALRTEELEQARSELMGKTEQLQRLLKSMVHLQEEERARIARDLHDGSNQIISGTLFELQAAEQSLRHERVAVTFEKLEKVKDLLRTIEAENRRLITGLRPVILDTQGLAGAVKWHADSFLQHYRVPCYVTISGLPVRLPADVETAVYRIVQEALNNIAAHARARLVRLQLDFTPQALHARVEDDGVGFSLPDTLAQRTGHLGLISMQERAQSIGGVVKVYSLPGQGTRLELEVPLAPLSGLFEGSP